MVVVVVLVLWWCSGGGGEVVEVEHRLSFILFYYGCQQYIYICSLGSVELKAGTRCGVRLQPQPRFPTRCSLWSCADNVYCILGYLAVTVQVRTAVTATRVRLLVALLGPVLCVFWLLHTMLSRSAMDYRASSFRHPVRGKIPLDLCILVAHFAFLASPPSSVCPFPSRRWSASPPLRLPTGVLGFRSKIWALARVLT